MAFESEFVPLPLEQLHREAALMKAEGWRFMQTHAVNGEAGIDLYYSFMKDGLARNYKVEGVTKDQSVPSITDLFLAAFVFENEARELFGVDMRDIALDFQGAMYAPAVGEPMTIISPEQKAAREKAAKAAAAKAEKEQAAGTAPAADAAGGGEAGHVFVMTPERRARLDAKLATMSPEKVAKVQAALKAREEEAKNAASGAAAPAKADAPAAAEAKPKAEPKPAAAVAPAPVDAVLEEKIAHLDADKAAKVRAALARKNAGGTPTAGPGEEAAPATAATADADLEAKIALLSPEKAEKVRAALARKEGE